MLGCQHYCLDYLCYRVAYCMNCLWHECMFVGRGRSLGCLRMAIWSGRLTMQWHPTAHLAKAADQNTGSQHNFMMLHCLGRQLALQFKETDFKAGFSLRHYSSSNIHWSQGNKMAVNTESAQKQTSLTILVMVVQITFMHLLHNNIKVIPFSRSKYCSFGPV